MHPKDSFCSYCGLAYTFGSSYPKTCTGCGAEIWSNPIPVGVVLLPVKSAGRLGLLVIRRGIDPRMGLLAFAGGFLEDHETWQAGAARELSEETGILVDPATIQPFWFTSSQPRPNRVLLFGEAPAVEATALPKFEATSETTARGVVFGDEGLDALFAFPLHVAAARKWLAAHALTGANGFTEL